MRKTTIAGSEAQTSLISLVVGGRFPTLQNVSNPSFVYWFALHEEFRLLGNT